MGASCVQHLGQCQGATVISPDDIAAARTELTVIIGFAELLLTERYGPAPNERYRRCLVDIRRAGIELEALVRKEPG